MLQRRRNREVTLFGKAHEMSEHNCEVFLVIHHHDDDRYVVYNSEPDDEWPRSYEMIVSNSNRCGPPVAGRSADVNSNDTTRSQR